MKSVKTIETFRLTSIDLDGLEATETHVWLSRTQQGTVYTVRGVPSSMLDILIVPLMEGLVPVIDLAKKYGKYDGAERHRITVRNVPPHQAPTRCVSAWFNLTYSHAVVHLGDQQFKFGRYRSILTTSNDLRNIVRWHYSRYYKMLAETDVTAVEFDFVETMAAGNYTLAEANRLASRLLYRAARNCGV